MVEEEDEDVEQRPRQRQRLVESESDGEDDEGIENEGESHRDAVESPDAQLVKKLVRYAMACDFSRTAIRRDGIKEKGASSLQVTWFLHRADDGTVLGDQGRAFKRVFEGAQKTLRQVFGMEMVELPMKDRLTKEEKRKGEHALFSDRHAQHSLRHLL